MYQLLAVPGLDARRVEIGNDRDEETEGEVGAP
jgi:hypothetical protein